MSCITVEYPALVYQNNKSKLYVANCITKKLLGYGKTEKDAIVNLEAVLNKTVTDYPVKVRAVKRYLSDLA